MNRMPVLVVDDHPRYRELFCQLLCECFPQVQLTTAGDGSEALRLAEQMPYSLVVLDYQLPWINGGDVVRQLRTRCQHRGVSVPPIVLTTSEPDGARLARIIGANGFLPKPTSLEEIRSVIGPILRPAQPVPPVQLAQPAPPAQPAQEPAAPRLWRIRPRTTTHES